MTPEQQAVVDLWDFEGVMETAHAAVLTANGMKAATPATITKFQEERPRVNVIFKSGGEQPSGQRTILPNGVQVSGAYKGTLAFSIITSSEEASKLVHSQYRVLIRWIMKQIGALVNGTLLTLHKIQWAVESGSSLIFQNDQGYWVSSIEYAIDFTLQTDAIKALTTPTIEPQE